MNTNVLLSAAFGSETLVAVGENGVILQSGRIATNGLHIDAPLLKNGVFGMSVKTNPDEEYILEFKNRLDDVQWQFTERVSGNGDRVQMSDTNASSSTRFYRLRRQ